MTRKITSVNEFNDIVHSFSEKVDKASYFSNFILLNPQLQELIQTGLYAQLNKGRVLFLCDKGSHYRCFGAFDINREQEPINLGLPIVFDLDYGSDLNEIQRLGLKCLEGLRFQSCAISVRMRLAFDSLHYSFTGQESPILLKKPSEQDAILIESLWSSSLDPSTYLAYTHDELLASIHKGRLLCAYLNGRLVGAVQYVIQRRGCLIQHLAVQSDQRGESIGKRLLLSALERAEQKGANYSWLWVMTNNTHAIAFYKHLGYNLENKHSMRLIYK